MYSHFAGFHTYSNINICMTQTQKFPPQPWRTRFARHRAQCKFRSEPTELTAADYYDIWQQSGHADACGRQVNSYTMVRANPALPWRSDNCAVISRQEHSRSIYKRYVQKTYTEQSYVAETDK